MMDILQHACRHKRALKVELSKLHTGMINQRLLAQWYESRIVHGASGCWGQGGRPVTVALSSPPRNSVV